MLFNKIFLTITFLLCMGPVLSQQFNLEEQIQQPIEYHDRTEPLLFTDEMKNIDESMNITDKAIKEISRVELAMFIEGLLYGIIGEQYVELDKCMKDISSLQNDLYLALHDFEQENFESMR